MCFLILVAVLSTKKASNDMRRIELVQIGDDETNLKREWEPPRVGWE